MNVRIQKQTQVFIENLVEPQSSKTIHLIETLKQYGKSIGMPHSKPLGNGWFELRVTGKIEIRYLYVFRNNEAVILHGFVKKQMAIHLKELHVAQTRLQQLDEL